MNYYLAPSLVALRSEFNAAYPNRDKASDGWIGDASHAARKSDHNPDWDADGVVRAIDVDKDGIEPAKALGLLIVDDRVEYVIFDGFIYSRTFNFVKRVYTGENKHEHHIHISIRHLKTAEDDVRNWGIYTGGAPAEPVTQSTPVSPPPVVVPAFPLPDGFYFGPKSGPRQSVSGYFGNKAALAMWQEQMRSRGWTITVDGLYGPQTEDVIRKFQAEKGLVVDGKIGIQTWAAAWTAPVT